MNNYENLFADFKLHIQELQSSIKILQIALQNEDEQIEKSDVDNCLELLSGQIVDLINESDTIADRLFAEK